MRYAPLLLTAVLVLAIPGCENRGADSGDPLVTNNATALLGLNRDFNCTYVQYDSVITYPPFSVLTDTTWFAFSCIAVDGSRSQFDLSFDSTKTAALRITTNSVANLGWYSLVGGHDSLVFFPEPPELFPIAIRDGQSWDAYTPPVFGTTSRLFLSWGFETTRRFDRRESVLLPLGYFNSYVFVCEYRLPGDDEPFMTASEHYASGYGLIKLRLSGPFGSTQIFMTSHDTTGLW